MRILITGGAGFIGSHIVDAYLRYGHKVTIIDNLSSGKRQNINNKAKFYYADITDLKKITQIFIKEKFDVVNHHAAQIDVRKSVADPILDAKINILGTINILENCIKYKVKKIIFASSGGVMYGDCGKIPPREAIPAYPLSPYGVSKRTAEIYLDYYAKIYGLKYLIFRYGNVYGPRQDPHGEAGVVAIFTQRMIKDKLISIFGNGEQLRDYVYIEDVVKANILGLKKGINEIVNIGTQKATSVNTLSNLLAKITHYSQKPIYKPGRLGELNKSFLDIDKAKKVLGWNPEINLEEGLQKTIQYFRNRCNPCPPTHQWRSLLKSL